MAKGLLVSMIETHLEKTVRRKLPLGYYILTLAEWAIGILYQAAVALTPIQRHVLIRAGRKVPAGAAGLRDTPRFCPFCYICHDVTTLCDKVISQVIIVGSTHSFYVIVVAAGKYHDECICPVKCDLQAKICLQNPFSP